MIVLTKTVSNSYAIELNQLDYDHAIDMVKEVMASYYVKGPAIQYNYAMTNYGIESPEDATMQDPLYVVCAGYVYDVYREAFGVNKEINNDIPSENFPRYVSEIRSRAVSYYEENKKDSTKYPLNGNFIIAYNVYEEEHTGNYIYGQKKGQQMSVEEFVNYLHPGDILDINKHALIVYEVTINPETNKKDALLLNGTSKADIFTQAKGDTTIRFDTYPASFTTNIIDIPKEGGIQLKWLSDHPSIVDENNYINTKRIFY